MLVRAVVCYFTCIYPPPMFCQPVHYSFNTVRRSGGGKTTGGGAPLNPLSFIPVHSEHALYISILRFRQLVHIHLPLTKQIAVHPTRWPQSQSGEAGSSLTQIRVN